MESDIVYTTLSEGDADEVTFFMAQHFYPREPLSTGLHMTYDDNKDWIHSSVRDWTRSGVSVVAKVVTTNEIIGTCLGTILTRNQNTSFDEAMNSPKTKVKTLHKVLSVLEASVNFFEKFNVDRILELAMITVSDKYGGKGIGKKLVQESESYATKVGCQIATAQATAVPSQKMLQRIGYQTIFELDYATFKINGENVFDMEKMMGSPSAKVMSHLLVNSLPPRSRSYSWRSSISCHDETIMTKSENIRPNLDIKNT